jgi:hypothetical protein
MDALGLAAGGWVGPPLIAIKHNLIQRPRLYAVD